LPAPTIPLRTDQIDLACRLKGLTSHNQLAAAMGVNRSTVTRALSKGEATPGFIARLRVIFPGSTVEDFCTFEGVTVEATSA
jgi:plasmid maintenance system antidote protein VapI